MRRWLLASLAFAAAAGGHFLLFERRSARWEMFQDPGWQATLQSYVHAGELYLGLSYALASGFTVLMLARAISLRRQSLAGAVVGGSLLGLLYTAGCWLVGCCGSPLLPVYLSLLGARASSLGGPIVLGVTVLSIGVSSWIVARRGRCIDPASTCCEAAGSAAHPRA